MQILKDFDNLYGKARDAFIGYIFGSIIAGVISLAIFGMLLSGWSPIPKRISEQPRSTLKDPFTIENGVIKYLPAEK